MGILDLVDLHAVLPIASHARLHRGAGLIMKERKGEGVMMDGETAISPFSPSVCARPACVFTHIRIVVDGQVGVCDDVRHLAVDGRKAIQNIGGGGLAAAG